MNKIFFLERDYTVPRLAPAWCVKCGEELDASQFRPLGNGRYRMTCSGCQTVNDVIILSEAKSGSGYFKKPRRFGGPSPLERIGNGQRNNLGRKG
jgi:hypothetical protein